MTQKPRRGAHLEGPSTASPLGEAAARDEEALRLELKQTESSLRDRFDEPIARATKITKATMAWFPIRVWRHFLQHNGFLLAAGVSYQALFAIFAAVYVAFAITGLWLGGSPEAIAALISIINGYIPGLISDKGGVITPEHATAIATSTTGLLSVTGLFALGALLWTAIGWVTFSRRAVRDIFGLDPDRRNYFILKARDLIAAGLFGLALLLGAALSSVGSFALDWLLSLFDLKIGSTALNGTVRVGTAAVSFGLNSVALAAMFRFLTGTSLQWHTVWPGAFLGGGAMTVLQLGTGLLLSYTPSNPLLATFAVFIGLLLWFRLQGIVMLIAASWVAVSSLDNARPLTQQTRAERLAAEHQALKIAANVRLREAHAARESAPWYRIIGANRTLRAAEAELARVEASTPVVPRKRGSLFE